MSCMSTHQLYPRWTDNRGPVRGGGGRPLWPQRSRVDEGAARARSDEEPQRRQPVLSCPGVLPRHSVDAPTQPPCIASHDLRFRNRLTGAAAGATAARP